MNLPRDLDGLHAETCPGVSACVVTAIKKDLEVLSSGSASQAQKLASLKFLGHWVGDIHQPLHVSFEDDRGGNNVLVTGECSPTSIPPGIPAWCSRLWGATPQRPPPTDENDHAGEIESWTRSAPVDWANESFAIAEQAQTKYCIRQGASCASHRGK